MKTIKIAGMLAIATLFVLTQSCKKVDTPTPPAPSSYVFNGVKYNSVKTYYKADYFNLGGTYYSALIDSAMNDDKSKALVFVLAFNKIGRPNAAADYYVYMPSGLPATTPNLVTADVYIGDIATNHISSFGTVTGTLKTATVTDNGKLKVEFPAMSFEGQEYNSSGGVVATIPAFSFAGFTFTEQ